MNPEQLKKSILQFALQGKLTDLEFSQPKDRGHFLSTKHEISNFNSSADEELFEIPHHWTWTKLKDISQYIKAGGDKPKNFSIDKTDKHNVPVIANGKKNKGIVGYTEESKISDVCLTISGRGTIGYTEIREEPFVPIVRLIVVSPLPNVSIHYLKYYLNAFLAPSVGTSIPQLTIPMIKEKSIALPPLEEQKKIVEKLDFIFNVLDKYEKSYTLLLNLQKSFPNQLEKSILQYAFEGKLVEQNTSDEPALELLKRISEQKQQMVKEKIIKKEKSIPPITGDEIPFDIPDSWEWVRIGDIGSWRAGSTPSRSNPLYYNGEIPWIKTGELNDGYIDASNEFISASALKECSLPLNKPGSVLIAMYGATIGKVGILNVAATTNQACCASYPFEGVYNKYLFYYLISMRNHFRSSATGGAQPNISKEKLIKTLIPLPPFNEQVRIANILDEILSSIKTQLVY